MARPLVPDDLWRDVEPLLPRARPRRARHPGRRPLGDRECLTGILFVLRSGLRWEALPREMGCGSGVTCWRRLRSWRRAGAWPGVRLLLESRLPDTAAIDWSRAEAGDESDVGHSETDAASGDASPRAAAPATFASSRVTAR